MGSIPFDTHEFVKELLAAGFTQQQAETQVRVLARLVYDQLATKRDLKELELRLTIRIGGIVAAGIAVLAVMVKLL